MFPSPFRQSDLRRIGFGALRAVPKCISNAQEGSRERLVIGISQKGENDNVQCNTHSAISNGKKSLYT